MKRERVPYKVKIEIRGMKTNEDIHRFIEDFSSRYASRISKGEDLKALYDFELEAFMEDLKVFHIDTEYTNEAGITITIRSRGEEHLVFEYEGNLYSSEGLWFGEDGVEAVMASDMLWYADQYTKENEVNDGHTEEQA